MAPTPEPPPRSPTPRSWLGLFLPSILLLLLAVLWSAGWFWIRNRAGQEMDAWLAREATEGRRWTCADRSIGGYPFRLELRCAGLSLARSDGGFQVGPVTAVVQVYQPRRGIVQVGGPFHTQQGDLVGDATWTSLEGSFHGASDGFVRASLVVDDLAGHVRGAEPGPIDFGARHLEGHARPAPGRFDTQGAIDVSLRLAQGAFPQLDPLVGNADPADVALDATLERATSLGTGTLAHELETWRQLGGRLDVGRLSISKGERRVQAKGEVGIDEAHRPDGQFDLRAAGLEALIGQVMGQRFGERRGALIGNLVGQFLGGLQRREEGAAASETAPAAAGDASLKPLPALRLAGGRLMLGPLPIPNVALPPLY